MGALTGQTVQSSYLDLVQLGKSGAGLPSHAGKEAAVYDGSGAQILGRTAVRHWLDPHPDAAAFAETWEFSTTGDMTQGQLEAAGWTFTSCTGYVSNGIMWIDRAASAYWRASLDVNFAGDFDVVVAPVFDMSYTTTPGIDYYVGGVGVGDTVNDVAHAVFCDMVSGYGRRNSFINGTWSNLGGTNATVNTYGPALYARIARISGTVYLAASSGQMVAGNDNTTMDRFGWSGLHTVSDADTYQKLYLTKNNATGTGLSGFKFIRRFQ